MGKTRFTCNQKGLIMSSKKKESKASRRDFLKTTALLPVGAAAGASLTCPWNMSDNDGGVAHTIAIKPPATAAPTIHLVMAPYTSAGRS